MINKGRNFAWCPSLVASFKICLLTQLFLILCPQQSIGNKLSYFLWLFICSVLFFRYVVFLFGGGFVVVFGVFLFVLVFLGRSFG